MATRLRARRASSRATASGATTHPKRRRACSGWCLGPRARRMRRRRGYRAAAPSRRREAPMVVYYRPDTIAEALALRAGGDLVVLSGGTDVYPAKAARAGWGDMEHKDVLDISALCGLRGIREEEAYWRLGALTTWSDLIEADLPPLFAGYQLAAREIGGVQIQNYGTLVGNICTASPAGDGAPNLLALEAKVELKSLGGTRLLEMAAFIDGYRRTACRDDEIVTAILVPKRGRGAHGHFLKLGARQYLVISIVMVAGVIETDAAGNVVACTLAVGACSAVPQRLSALEARLIGVPLAEAGGLLAAEHLGALSPIDDIRASAAYRRAAALALMRDLLADLAGAQMGRAA